MRLTGPSVNVAVGVGEVDSAHDAVVEGHDVTVDIEAAVGRGAVEGHFGSEGAHGASGGRRCYFKCCGIVDGRLAGGPHEEVVFAGEHFHIHVVVGRGECGAVVGLAHDELAVAVVDVEGHRFHFVGKCVGPLHVHVVGEGDSVVYRAVALVVIYGAVTRRQRPEGDNAP